MTSKHKKLSEQIKSGHVKMTFGGEKLFNAQHHLKESGFSSYNEWKEAYNFAINHDVFYISRLDEKLENQIVRLTPSEDGRFSMKLLIDLPFLEEKKKFIEVKGIQISSEDKFTRDFLLNTIRKIRKSLIIYHFYKMESGKWNLQIIFNTDDMDSFTNL